MDAIRSGPRREGGGIAGRRRVRFTDCGSVAAWQRGSVAAWQSGSVAAWQRGRVNNKKSRYLILPIV